MKTTGDVAASRSSCSFSLLGQDSLADIDVSLFYGVDR